MEHGHRVGEFLFTHRCHPGVFYKHPSVDISFLPIPRLPSADSFTSFLPFIVFSFALRQLQEKTYFYVK